MNRIGHWIGHGVCVSDDEYSPLSSSIENWGAWIELNWIEVKSMAMDGGKVLITGACGFLGNLLATQLAQHSTHLILLDHAAAPPTPVPSAHYVCSLRIQFCSKKVRFSKYSSPIELIFQWKWWRKFLQVNGDITDEKLLESIITADVRRYSWFPIKCCWSRFKLEWGHACNYEKYVCLCSIYHLAALVSSGAEANYELGLKVMDLRTCLAFESVNTVCVLMFFHALLGEHWWNESDYQAV